jgi:hypothetical protein
MQIPEFYRTIDLRIHNANFDCKPQRVWDVRVPPDFIERKWTHHDYAVYEKQRKLIKALQERPELSKCVRNLTWTIMAVPRLLDEEWEDEEAELGHELLQNHTDVSCKKDDHGGCTAPGQYYSVYCVSTAF